MARDYIEQRNFWAVDEAGLCSRDELLDKIEILETFKEQG